MQTRNGGAQIAPPQNASETADVAKELRSSFSEFQTRLDTRLAALEQRPNSISMEQIRSELKPHADAIAEMQEALTKAHRPRTPDEVTRETSQAHRAAFATFLRTGDPAELVALNAWKPEMAERMKETRATVGSEVSQPLGGYVVLPDVDTNIDRIKRVYSQFRDHARVVQIGGREYVRDVKTSGATITWVEEGSTTEPDADAMSFKEIRIPAREARAVLSYSRNLLVDAYFDLNGEISLDLAEAYGVGETDAFINGTGVGQPKGVLSANRSFAEQTGRTEPSFGTIGFVKTGSTSDWGPGSVAGDKLDCFQKTIARMKPEYLEGAAWFTNRTSIAQIMLIKDTTGLPIWVPSLIAGNAATIRNYPVRNIEEMPDGASAKYPMLFANMKQGYTVVDRAGMEVLINPYRTMGRTRFETYKRVGGDVNKSEAIKAIKWAS